MISKNSQSVDAVLSKLEGVKENGSGWIARCVAHEDTNPSLSIGQGDDGRVLLKCFAGCEPSDIIEALGMKMRDLFPARRVKRRSAAKSKSEIISVAAIGKDKSLPVDFLRGLGVKDHPRGVMIEYRLENGSRAERRRLRTALKAKEGSRWAGTGGLVPYGLDLLSKARKAGFLIIPEGESDCWTLWYHSYPALGLPGAEMSGLLQRPYLSGIDRIYVIHEPDGAGDKFVQGVAARVRKIGWVGEMLEVKLPGAKDPNELHKQSPKDFKAALQAALDAAPELKVAAAAPLAPDAQWRDPHGRYYIENDQTFQIRFDRDGIEHHIRLSNFSARIVEETVLDDGAEESRVLSVEGRRAGGRILPLVRVLVAKFQVMNWPFESWGVGAFIEPGLGAKDQLRAAIQTYSGDDVPRRTIFKHTGWRLINATWYYLSGGGAIGPNGIEPSIEVNLTGPLSRYVLPAPPVAADCIAAIRASLAMLGAAQRRITYPCLAAVYRAPLGETDLGIHICGPTGAGKTEISAQSQQHYGAEMGPRNLPGSWSSTGNALEATAFGVKDGIFTVDDFAPTGSSNDVQRFHRDADRVFRAQGNQAGRQRMNSDATLKPAKYPRGMILSSGEDVPKGQSLRARLLILEMSQADMDWGRLTACQKYAGDGLYAQSMAGFVRWLAPVYGDVRGRLLTERNELAVVASGSTTHKRTPRIVADLALGLRYFLAYAIDAGAITETERSRLWKEGWQALGDAANAQAKHQDAYNPAKRFLELVGSALSTGEAHLAMVDGKAPRNAAAWGWRETGYLGWQPQGKRIGWIKGDAIYLDQEGAFSAAQEVGRKTGDALTITSHTLRKRIKEGGLLVAVDSKRETLTVRHTLEGRMREVLHLRLSSLSPANEPDISDTREAPTLSEDQSTCRDSGTDVRNVGCLAAVEVDETDDADIVEGD